MSSSSKKNMHKQLTSLDEKHSEMLAYFERLESHNIPQLQEEVANLKSHLKTLPKTQIDVIMETKDKIKEKKKQIKSMQKEKQDYFLNNSKYIFDYFESKQQISSGEPPQNVNVLNSFFKVKSSNPEKQDIAKYVQAKKLYQDYWYNVNNEFTNKCVRILELHTSSSYEFSFRQKC